MSFYSLQQVLMHMDKIPPELSLLQNEQLYISEPSIKDVPVPSSSS